MTSNHVADWIGRAKISDAGVMGEAWRDREAGLHMLFYTDGESLLERKDIPLEHVHTRTNGTRDGSSQPVGCSLA